MSSVPPPSVDAWKRRPASAVTRLKGRPLLLLSSRDLLRAALDEQVLLVALAAPSAAAMAGFARAARDQGAPLLLVRPSGLGEERGPEETKEDLVFVETALKAADALGFLGPMALLKEPPRSGAPVQESERVDREVEAGFTGLAVTADDVEAPAARDAALQAARACRLELGLEVVGRDGMPALASEMARDLAARGTVPSALRATGHESEARALADLLGRVAISSEREAQAGELAALGVQQLVAAGPFLRALRRAAPPETWHQLQRWADERGAALEQSAARHARALRDLPPAAQEKLEALCCYEAEELYARAGAVGTGLRIAARIARYSQEAGG